MLIRCSLIPIEKSTHLTKARSFLTTTMIKNTYCAGIPAAAGTRLTHNLIRLVINSIINYPKSTHKELIRVTHKIRNNEAQEKS